MNKTYDIGIIGGGPAGYTVAVHSGRRGMSVVLFEKEQLGGVCLNKGCIPTKTILHTAEIYEEIKTANEYGICADNIRILPQKIFERKNQVVTKLRKGLELALKNSGTTIIQAEAEVLDRNKIIAGGETYNCNKIIVATGSEPKTFIGMEFDHKNILCSDDILELSEIPQSITIVGSGAIGIEWARIFSAFGADVTIIEAAESLLPVADIEVSKRIERIFKTRKIKIYKSTTVNNINCNGICNINFDNGQTIQSEKVLIAVGRTVPPRKRFDGIAYIGDVCEEIQLAHYASKQAIELIDGIPFDKNLVPSVIYGNPEIAWAGKREQDLEPNSYKKSMILISALGKSHCDNSTEGFIKILSQNEKIVGAHIVAKEASAMIQQLIIAMQNNIDVAKLKEVCFAHPTYSEGIFEALFNL